MPNPTIARRRTNCCVDWECMSSTTPFCLMREAGSRLDKPQSFLSTSDNLIVEAVRRVGGQIEVRLSEWSGAAGTGEVTLHLPHNSARLTNLMGEQGVALAGGPKYRFP